LNLNGSTSGSNLVFNGGSHNNDLTISGPFSLTGSLILTNISGTSSATLSGTSTVAKLLINNAANTAVSLSGPLTINGSAASVAGGFTLENTGIINLNGTGGLIF